MATIIEMRNELKTINDEMEKLLNTAISENREMTQDEDTKYKEFRVKNDELIKKVETMEAYEKDMELVQKQKAELVKVERKMYFPYVKRNPENDQEFETFGQFLRAACIDNSDPRLRNVEYREQSMGTGTKGGFAVPPQFIATLMEVPMQEAILTAKARLIPAGEPPDTPVTMVTMDQSLGKGKLSGVDVAWTAEGGLKTETEFYLKEITLTPHELSGYIVVTDKLLRNWAAAEMVITTKLRQAINHIIELSLMTGNGVGQPLGILNSGATIKVTRTGATSIVWADIYNMYSRAMQEGNSFWTYNQTCLPKLITLKDDASHLVWQPSAREAEPNRIMGMPAYLNNRLPVLGSEGDIALLDMQYYLKKPGSGPFVGMSEHVYFTRNKTVVKAFTNIDGQPWLSTVVPLENSTVSSYAVSPFVVLTT